MLRIAKLAAVLVLSAILTPSALAQDYTAAARAAWCAGAERQWLAEVRANPPFGREHGAEIVEPIERRERFHTAFAAGYFGQSNPVALWGFVSQGEKAGQRCHAEKRVCFQRHSYTWAQVSARSGTWAAYTGCVSQAPACADVLRCLED